MRVLVCGGRAFAHALPPASAEDERRAEVERALLYRTLDGLHLDNGFTLVIHGECRGADMAAKWWAAKRGVPEKGFPADWKAFGPSAGPRRNAQMLSEGKPDLVIAFRGGPGTANMVKLAEDAGVPVYRVT